VKVNIISRSIEVRINIIKHDIISSRRNLSGRATYFVRYFYPNKKWQRPGHEKEEKKKHKE